MKTSRKHIDVVVKYFYPVAAGIETNILETYSILASMGWDITIHTSRDQYLEKNSLPERETIRGLQIRRYPFISDISGLTPDISWDGDGIIALHNFNVSFWKILVKTMLLKLIGKKHFRLVITPHGGFTPEWSMYSAAVKLFKIPYHYVFGTFMVNTVVDGIRAVSEWERKEIEHKGVRPSKIRVISNGIEDEAFGDIENNVSESVRRIIEKTGPYIIQIGRIYPIKNYETVIRALPHIPPTVSYVIVGQEEGGSDYKQSLIRLASDLGVADRVKFMGVLRGYDKYYAIGHALLMVHMAVWESFCNVVHEGMSQGDICIVANNTALPYLVKDGVNGYLVDTRDWRTLSDKIRYVIENNKTKEMETIRMNNRKFGLSHSWKHVAREMDDLYSSLTDSH
jgi:glycosyltransferase involved in cell wall biosynthesis